MGALVKKRGRLGEEEVKRFMGDIIKGFLELAEFGYLHRDLKLANIFLREGKAVIADFGFAKKH